ncbi:MAG TPA: PLP-dependent aminotransferase family protein [Solirubrobacteraceae bacterium]|nr:PLP-dependent aminotransferase family protein [Solirubrobacteraceae bacterium]
MATPAPISFARGAPSLDIIDVDGLHEAAHRAFNNDPGGATAYGTAVGYVPLRRWIAERHGVQENQVLVTNGSMQADAFLFDELVGPGDCVVVERPSYDRTLLSLRQHGAELTAIALEPDGIDVDALERALVDGLRPKLAHIIPNFHNPAGYTLSGPKRKHLLLLAREYDFLIFEDDPYIALRFRGETQPTMLSLDAGAGAVVYASSFSKTVCPGIRVGFLIGPSELIARIVVRATNTYISPSMVDAAIVYEFCASGSLDRSIERVKGALQERVRTLSDALSEQIPGASFVAPDGGYFLWLSLPSGLDPGAVLKAAADQGLALVSGDDFVLDGGSGAVRLAFSGVTPAEIREGVGRLAAALATLA